MRTSVHVYLLYNKYFGDSMKHGIIVVLFFLCAVTAHAQWTNGQNASSVVGQSDYSTYTTGVAMTNLNRPKHMTIDFINGKAYVADAENYRVLRFSYPFMGTPPAAEMQFGAGNPNVSKNTFNSPVGVAVYNNKLYVLDQDNNRILLFDNASTASTKPDASGIIGHTSYTDNGTGSSSTTFNGPTDIKIDGSGNLWVADASNNRVLKYSNIAAKPTNGTAAADLVLGQIDFLAIVSGTSQATLTQPHGVAINGTTVWVSDFYNYRILRYDNPSSNGQNASGVLGQPNFEASSNNTTQSTFTGVEDVAVDGNGIVYALDGGNNRIMIYLNAAAKSNGADADYELGKSSSNYFTWEGEGVGITGFSHSYGLCIDNANKKLYVADYSNNRILGFTAASALPVELSSFIASVGNNSVILNWKTATETNNYGFEIQRSVVSPQQSDNMWSKIGFIEGSGTTNAPKSYSFTDKSANGKTSYRLKQIDRDGKFEYSQSVEVTASSTPNEFGLEQNYPNPFNPTTAISYQLSANGFTTLKIYDAIGREVVTLVNEVKEAGTYSAQFDGAKLSSGIYFAKLSSSGKTQIRKLVLMK